jgi:PH (Pleckstrin Homology) domain-containing protein
MAAILTIAALPADIRLEMNGADVIRPPGRASQASARAAAGGRHFYRNRVSNLLVWLIAAFCVDYFSVQGAAALSDGSTALAVGALALMALWLVPLARVPFHGVVASAEGVRIRNVWGSHSVGWSEIERFETGSYGPWPWTGIAVLKSGRRIPIVGIQRGAIGRSTERTVAALNERLAEAGAE